MNAPMSLGRGFADPVFGPQAVFRCVLDAMSRPGRIVQIPSVGIEGPQPWPPAAFAILLALCDHETSVWMDEASRAGELKNWLSFHCGALLTEEPASATFALIAGDGSHPSLTQFAQGDDRYPDRSTTLVVACHSLQGGAPWTLSGPGIRNHEIFSPHVSCHGLLEEAVTNHALFPLGVDMLFVSGDAVVGLPRSTQLTAMEGN